MFATHFRAADGGMERGLEKQKTQSWKFLP